MSRYKVNLCGDMNFLDCPHNPNPRLGYLEFHADAERRWKRGERQRRCPKCQLLVWDYLWPPGVELPPVERLGGFTPIPARVELPVFDHAGRRVFGSPRYEPRTDVPALDLWLKQEGINLRF